MTTTVLKFFMPCLNVQLFAAEDEKEKWVENLNEDIRMHY